MKTICSEYLSNYGTYTFGYANYALPIGSTEYTQAYESWYLPYSASLEIEEPIFYLCRSLRVDTSVFTNGSENRRVARKVEELAITTKRYQAWEFDRSDSEFVDFCLAYTNSRFSHGDMSPERFKYVMSRDYANMILEFRSHDRVIGYTLFAHTDHVLHHWFCFFDTELMDSAPLGKYMMRYTIDRAKQNWVSYVYLGTCYKESWLYKVRDFNWLERRDGNIRQTNVERLKQLCKSDTEEKYRDQLKDHPSLFV
jgi:leucyl-tRNA---protein transferase